RRDHLGGPSDVPREKGWIDRGGEVRRPRRLGSRLLHDPHRSDQRCQMPHDDLRRQDRLRRKSPNETLMPYAARVGWGNAMPPAVLTNDVLSTFLDTSDEWITTRTGM